MRAPLLALLALTLATPAAADDRSGEAELASVIGNRVAGKPVDCIDPHTMITTQVITGTAIVYGDGRRLFVNRLLSGASTLRRDDILVTRIVGTLLCRLDTITLADSTSPIPHGSVTLGDFVPYDRPR